MTARGCSTYIYIYIFGYCISSYCTTTLYLDLWKWFSSNFSWLPKTTLIPSLFIERNCIPNIHVSFQKIILVLTPPTAQFWLRNQQSLSRSARNSRLSADGPAQWLCWPCIGSHPFPPRQWVQLSPRFAVHKHFASCQQILCCLLFFYKEWFRTLTTSHSCQPLKRSAWTAVAPECVPLWISSLHLPEW